MLPPSFRSAYYGRQVRELQSIFAELPLDWLHVDGDVTLPMQLDVERVISTLELPFTDPATFWKLP